jgi:hypothetical protein
VRRHGPPSARAVEDERLLVQVRAAFRQSRRHYGVPRIQCELQSQGIAIARKRVARLMREDQMVARARRRCVRTTDSDHAEPIAPNRLERRFDPADYPIVDRAWVGDMTYVPTREGWLFLAVLLDLCSRRVVGWATGSTLQQDILQQDSVLSPTLKTGSAAVPRGPAAFVLLCMLAGCHDRASSARLDPVLLGTGEVALARPFDHIAGFAPLSDTLGVVVDRDAKAVYLIDWTTTAVTPTGHEGAGPGEHQSLGAPLPGVPGTVLMLDRRQRRVVAYDSTGWFNVADLRNLPLGIFLHGGDRDGNLYFEYRPVSHEGGGTTYADSSLILRLALDGAIDTVARLLAPAQVIHVIRGTNANGDVRSNSLAFEEPYSPRDVWAVNPDGGVIILRSDPVRLDRITDDSISHLSVIALSVIPVQESDKSDSLIPVPKEELPPWPEAMPPFVGTARLCGTRHRLIVRRPGHIGDSTETWLQLSPDDPKPVAFTISAVERVVGCDGTWLYTARTDSDEMEVLVRYGMR